MGIVNPKPKLDRGDMMYFVRRTRQEPVMMLVRREASWWRRAWHRLTDWLHIKWCGFRTGHNVIDMVWAREDGKGFKEIHHGCHDCPLFWTERDPDTAKFDDADAEVVRGI